VSQSVFIRLFHSFPLAHSSFLIKKKQKERKKSYFLYEAHSHGIKARAVDGGPMVAPYGHTFLWSPQTPSAWTTGVFHIPVTTPNPGHFLEFTILKQQNTKFCLQATSIFRKN
jgi:hypothetical protein